jgi:hypothetical protein
MYCEHLQRRRAPEVGCCTPRENCSEVPKVGKCAGGAWTAVWFSALPPASLSHFPVIETFQRGTLEFTRKKINETAETSRRHFVRGIAFASRGGQSFDAQ